MPSAALVMRAALLACVLICAGYGQAMAQPADPERAAILEAMRKRGDIPDRVFIVRSLKVRDGWAWITVRPQSRDGANRYESETALLRKDAAGWTVVDQPCGEADCTMRAEVRRIRAAHPTAPAALFRR